MRSRVPREPSAKLSGSTKKKGRAARKVDDIETRLVLVLRRVIGPKADLARTRLGLESMKMLQVVIAVENEFAISFPEDAPLGKVTASLSNLKRYVNKLIGKTR